MLSAVPAVSSAQSLADVARTATATRKDQPKAGKVYTNDNLRADITPSAPVAPAPAADGSTPPADGAMATTPADSAAAPSGAVTDARDQRRTRQLGAPGSPPRAKRSTARPRSRRPCSRR
jgi:hypothetical protein